MKTKWTFLNYAAIALSLLMTVSCSDDPDGDSGEADPDAGTGTTTTSIIVTLDSPAANAVDVSATPTFEWSIDSDLSGITYDVYTGTESTALYTEKTNLSVLTYTMEYAMPLGSTQYWKVVAKYDGEEYSSSVQSFTVEVFDAPILVAPADNDTFGSEATFEWEAIDREGITYILNFSEIDAVPANDFTITVPTEDAEEYTLTDEDVALFTDGASYTWSVTATDGANSATSAESRTIQKVVVGAPSAPLITAPEANALFDTTTNSVTLEWTEAIDPEGDDVTYSIAVTKGTTTEVVATDISALEYSYDISGDADGTMYTWYVIATDGVLDTESLSSVFYKADDILIVNSLKTPGILALTEAFVWEDAGDGFTYEVKLYKDGAWESVATDITETTYTLKNSIIPCDLITGAIEFKVQIVATDGTNTRESAEISFYPEMQGTFTDVRGTEVITYDWVRVSTQIWMAENLATEYFNDGTELTKLADSATVSDNSTVSFFACIPDTFYTSATASSYPIVSMDTYTINDMKDNLNGGYIYSRTAANDERLAPVGWRVINTDDAVTFLNYLEFVAPVIDGESYHNNAMRLFIDACNHTYAINKYGLNFAVGPLRQDAYWRPSLWDNKAHFTVIDKTTPSNTYRLAFGLKEGTPTDYQALESTDPDYVSPLAGNPYAELRTWSNATFAVRCILDE